MRLHIFALSHNRSRQQCANNGKVILFDYRSGIWLLNLIIWYVPRAEVERILRWCDGIDALGVRSSYFLFCEIVVIAIRGDRRSEIGDRTQNQKLKTLGFLGK